MQVGVGVIRQLLVCTVVGLCNRADGQEAEVHRDDDRGGRRGCGNNQQYEIGGVVVGVALARFLRGSAG